MNADAGAHSTPSSGPAPPTFLQIEPVGHCNLRCRMCPIQYRRDGPPYGPPAFLDEETFRRVLDQAPQIEELHLQGLGEPFLHPKFFEFVSYAAARGIRVTTNTNLTVLGPRLIEQCLASGLAYLHASLDGGTPETYEAIRCGSRFSHVVGNLKALLAARSRQNAPRLGVGLVMVLMRRNLNDLPTMVRLAHEWGVDSLFVQYLCHDYRESSLPAHYADMRTFVESETLQLDEARPVIAGSEALAAELGVHLRLPAMFQPSRRASGDRRCSWPWQGMYLSYQGDVMPCCMVSTPDRMTFGKAGQGGLANIWASDAYHAFRRQLDSDEPPEICRSCAVYKGLM